MNTPEDTESTIVEVLRFTIYCHTSPSGKRYVGQTSSTMMKRWGEHCRSAIGNGKRLRYPLHNAIRKYGTEAFVHEVLELVATQEAANERESFWISLLKTTDSAMGYNIRTGGNVSPVTEGTKQKIRAAAQTPERKSADRERMKRRWKNATQEELNWYSANGKRLAGVMASKTHEERSAIARRATESRSSEARSASAKKTWDNLAPEMKRATVDRLNRKTTKERSDEWHNWAAAKPPEWWTAKSKKGWANKTPEERSALAKKKWAGRTAEERRESAKRRWDSLSPEKQKAMTDGRKAMAPEERSAIAKKRQANKTPEERSEQVKKAWANRRLKRRPPEILEI